jgi:hypothetical protein
MLRTRARTSGPLSVWGPLGCPSPSFGIPSPSRIHGCHYSRFVVQLLNTFTSPPARCAKAKQQLPYSFTGAWLRPLCPYLRFPVSTPSQALNTEFTTPKFTWCCGLISKSPAAQGRKSAYRFSIQPGHSSRQILVISSHTILEAVINK